MSILKNNLLIFVVVLLLVVFSLVLASYWLVFEGKSVGFLSRHAEVTWDVDENRFAKVEQVYKAVRGGKLLVVYLAPDLLVSESSAGTVKDEPAVFYTQWEKFLGIDVLRVSVTDHWKNTDPLRSNRTLSLFIDREILEKEGQLDNYFEQTSLLLVGEDPATVSLKSK